MQNEIAQVPEENKDELLCNPSRKKIFYTTKNLDERQVNLTTENVKKKKLSSFKIVKTQMKTGRKMFATLITKNQYLKFFFKFLKFYKLRKRFLKNPVEKGAKDMKRLLIKEI